MPNVNDEIPFDRFDVDNDIEGSGVVVGDTFNRQRQKINGIINKVSSLQNTIETGSPDPITYVSQMGAPSTFNASGEMNNSSANALTFIDTQGGLHLTGWAYYQSAISYHLFTNAATDSIIWAPFVVNPTIELTGSGTTWTHALSDTYTDNAENSITLKFTEFDLMRDHARVLDNAGRIWGCGWNETSYNTIGAIRSDKGGTSGITRTESNGYIVGNGYDNSGYVAWPTLCSPPWVTVTNLLTSGPAHNQDCTYFIDNKKRLWATGYMNYGNGLVDWQKGSTGSTAYELPARNSDCQFYKSDPTVDTNWTDESDGFELLAKGAEPYEGWSQPHIVNYHVHDAAFKSYQSYNLAGVIRHPDGDDTRGPTVAEHNARSAPGAGNQNDPGGYLQMCGYNAYGTLGNGNTTATKNWVKVLLSTSTTVRTAANWVAAPTLPTLPGTATIEKIFMNCDYESGAFNVIVALRASGQTDGYDYLVSWGYNNNGLFGDGSTSGTGYHTPAIIWAAGSTYKPYANGTESGAQFEMKRIKSFSMKVPGYNAGQSSWVLDVEGNLFCAGYNLHDHFGLQNIPASWLTSGGLPTTRAGYNNVNLGHWLPSGYMSDQIPNFPIDVAVGARVTNINKVVHIETSYSHGGYCGTYLLTGDSPTQDGETITIGDQELWYAGYQNSYTNFALNGAANENANCEGFVRCHMLPKKVVNAIESIHGAVNEYAAFYGGVFFKTITGELWGVGPMAYWYQRRDVGDAGGYQYLRNVNPIKIDIVQNWVKQ